MQDVTAEIAFVDQALWGAFTTEAVMWQAAREHLGNRAEEALTWETVSLRPPAELGEFIFVCIAGDLDDPAIASAHSSAQGAFEWLDRGLTRKEAGYDRESLRTVKIPVDRLGPFGFVEQDRS